MLKTFNQNKNLSSILDLHQRIDNFLKIMTLLEELYNTAVQEPRWRQIIKLTIVELDTDKKFLDLVMLLILDCLISKMMLKII
jgi:hypothetical protein